MLNFQHRSMIKVAIVTICLSGSCAFAHTSNDIPLPGKFTSALGKGNNCTNSSSLGKSKCQSTINQFKTKMPSSTNGGDSWHYSSHCNASRPNSYNWRSPKLKDGKGLEVNIANLTRDKRYPTDGNEFAMFVHDDRCYHQSDEYGFSFREKGDTEFYICNHCNDKSQYWVQWPDSYKEMKPIKGDCSKVKQLMSAFHVQNESWDAIPDPKDKSDFIIRINDLLTGKNIASCELHVNQYVEKNQPDLAHHYSTYYITTNAKQESSMPNPDDQSSVHLTGVNVLQ